MRVLFLDDDETRHSTFARESIGHDVLHVRTAAEAIEALKAGPFDLACLDHDLGELQMVEPGTYGHGLDVARAIAACPASVGAVVVHSFNPAGALAMMAELRSAGVRAQKAPFGTWKLPPPAMEGH